MSQTRECFRGRVEVFDEAWTVAETLSLHDVRDATAFVAAIAVKSPLRLEWHDDADLREYLLGELWILSTRYDATASSISFATLAGNTLRLRVVDWTRQRFGRSRWQFRGHVYERPRPELISADDVVGVDLLERALAALDGDLAPGGDEAVGGLFRDRDRARARDLELLDLAAPP